MKNWIAALLTLVSFNTFADTAAGPGIGIPYGILGINLNHKATDNIDLSLGLGTTILDGSAYSVGAKYYFEKEESGVRLSAYYGTNAVIEANADCTGLCFGFADYEKFEGLTVGIGWGRRPGKSGWDVDVMYVVTTGADERIDELEAQGYEYTEGRSDIGFSFGYHWAF